MLHIPLSFTRRSYSWLETNFRPNHFQSTKHSSWRTVWMLYWSPPHSILSDSSRLVRCLRSGRLLVKRTGWWLICWYPSSGAQGFWARGWEFCCRLWNWWWYQGLIKSTQVRITGLWEFSLSAIRWGRTYQFPWGISFVGIGFPICFNSVFEELSWWAQRNSIISCSLSFLIICYKRSNLNLNNFQFHPCY